MTKLKDLIQNKFKIAITAVIALVITLILSQTVFWHNTPMVNPLFIVNSKAVIQKVISWPGNWLASLKSRSKTQEATNDLANLPTMTPENTIDPKLIADTTIFQPIGSGISTATDTSTGNKYIKIEAGTVVEVTEYTLVDGRRIQVIKPIN